MHVRVRVRELELELTRARKLKCERRCTCERTADRGMRVRWDWDLPVASVYRERGDMRDWDYNKRIPMLLRALKLTPGAHCTALTVEVAAVIST